MVEQRNLEGAHQSDQGVHHVDEWERTKLQDLVGYAQTLILMSSRGQLEVTFVMCRCSRVTVHLEVDDHGYHCHNHWDQMEAE